MNRDAVRLIADRGHGLSKPQLDAIRWLATDRREGAPPRYGTTWRSLAARGLVTFPPLELTDDGRGLAHRLGYWPGRGLTDEDGGAG